TRTGSSMPTRAISRPVHARNEGSGKDLNNQEQPDLLRAILHATARGPFPEDKLRKAVLGVRGGPRQVDAYNLCDGTRAQHEIAEEAGLDKGAFSRLVGRW